MLERLLKEPLVHFLALALFVFAIYGLIATETKQVSGRIVISAPRIEQLAAIFAKTWQRPPTPQELKGLIDDYVTEEIYVREALALRLDEDDTVIRRRLRQKMEFLTAAEAEATIPTDDALDAFMKENPKRFETEPQFAFQQVFLNPDRHGESIDQDAGSVLEILKTSPQADPSTLGDATLLPAALPLTSKASIKQIFGGDFAGALDAAQPGQWSGPILSTFGIHLIRVTAREPGRMPALSEVRDIVLREWTNERRLDAEKQRLDELLKRYDVTIEMPAAPGASP